MMSTKTIERLKQTLPFKKNVEEKVRGKELEKVWDDTNEWNEEVVWKTEMRGPGGLESVYPMFSP